jgi:hypothetical protein
LGEPHELGHDVPIVFVIEHTAETPRRVLELVESLQKA